MSLAAVASVLRRPDLWPVAIGVGRRMVDPLWWRRVPPVPRPAPAYAAMRHQAMFGSEPDLVLGPTELVAYLEWCARMRRLAR
jgi:hypothetical protein